MTTPGAGATVRRATKEDIVLTGPQQAVAPAATMAQTAPRIDTLTSDELLTRVIASLEDDKAEDIVQIDLRGKSAIADWMVVASGRSSRQVASISEKLVERLKQEHGVPCKIEGKDAGDWVLIDAGDVIVHVFRPEVRDFYQLEKMWLPAEAATAHRPIGRGAGACPCRGPFADRPREGSGGRLPVEIREDRARPGPDARRCDRARGPEIRRPRRRGAAAAQGDARGCGLWALDERGRQMTSPDFADTPLPIPATRAAATLL
jgi:ribosome-associated protein